MSEYIVDVGNAVEEYIEHFGCMAMTYADNPIRELIVRCKDCTWYLPFPGIQITYGICQKSHLEVNDNGFCAWGEKQ